jgi:hypothetical protein
MRYCDCRSWQSAPRSGRSAALFVSDLRLQVPFDRWDGDASQLEALELRFVLGLIRTV